MSHFHINNNLNIDSCKAFMKYYRIEYFHFREIKEGLFSGGRKN